MYCSQLHVKCCSKHNNHHNNVYSMRLKIMGEFSIRTKSSLEEKELGKMLGDEIFVGGNVRVWSLHNYRAEANLNKHRT
jgi:hypothetical protein